MSGFCLPLAQQVSRWRTSLTAVGFRRKTREIFTRLENMAAAEVQAAPVPAIIESFASRAVGRTPVPRAVRLRQTGEMRAAPDSPWRPFSAEQVIRISRPGFAWVARMQVVPLLSAQIRECYIDDQGLLEARLWGSLPLARLAGPETSKGELMRYLAELIWAPRAMRHNPALSWREIDAATVEVSAASPGGPARGTAYLRGWRYRSH